MIHLGDCIEWMATIADRSVDHVITDPPYEAEAHTKQRRITRGKGLVVAPLDFDPITAEQRDIVSVHFARIVRRWVVVFCQAEAVAAWRSSFERAGLVWKRAGIWLKPDGMPQLTGDRPGMGYESIAIAHQRGKSVWNGGGRHGVWRHGTNKGAGCAEHENRHPTQKPIALMESLVRDFTDHGDLVCDPFAGSGTTGVAALHNGRRFIGCELDPKYHAIAMSRIGRTHEQRELAL